jgi:hypothetical protein
LSPTVQQAPLNPGLVTEPLPFWSFLYLVEKVKEESSEGQSEEEKGSLIF